MQPIRRRLLQSVTPPASEPVTLAEAKLYLRVDSSADDTLITDLIPSARISAEQWLKRSLITQSWKIAFDDYIGECVELPMGPVSSITSVTTIARDGSTQTISSATYTLNAAKDLLLLDNMVYGDRVEIVYVAGYGAASSVPKPIKYGILGHIAAMYDQRGDAPVPDQSAGLYLPFREVKL